MSYIGIGEAKRFLDVIHCEDDYKLLLLLEGAENEALRFMERTQFGSLFPIDENFEAEIENMPESVRVGVYMLLQASYQATPEDQQVLRSVAETRLMPYRCCMGI